MSKISWSLKRDSPSLVDVTSSVLSFSYMQGRQNYLDSYSGGTLTVTLENQTNIAQYFTFNSTWQLIDSLNVNAQIFWCQGVEYNDYPGNTGLSTITVSLVDVLARNGRNVVTNVSLIQNDTISQLQTLWQTSPYQIGDITSSGTGSSTAAAVTYTGSMLNYFNLITSTEKGQINFYYNEVNLIPRNYLASADSGKSFSRNASTTLQLSYYSYNHFKANLNFMNNVTVEPGGLAQQTIVNSTSVTAYGNAQQTVTTVDATTTQAAGLAGWLAYSQSDPEAEYYSVSFLDIIQNDSVLSRFLETFNGFLLGASGRVWSLVSRVPGAGSDTTTKVVIEGISVNATPERTDFTVFMSPLTYYQFFTLDSTFLGILDTSRLGW